MGAFEAAENILEKQDATKEEVDQACANLRNAVFGLRLIPSKEKLEELIQSAEQIDVKLYTEESAENFMSALAKAKRGICRRGRNESGSRRCRTGTCKSNRRIEIKKKSEKKTKEKNAGAVKTGDSSTPILFAVIAVLSAGTIFFVRKKRRKEIYMLKKIISDMQK